MNDEDNMPEQQNTDRFSQFMFGSKRVDNSIIREERPSTHSSSIDYDELMGNIDLFMESARNLKPLFQKVFPLIGQFWKNK